MEAVKEGGRIFIMTQCDNAMGHGFYQFSPELFHRVFSPENGFALEQMFIAEGSFGKVPWHSVADPKDIRRQVVAMGHHEQPPLQRIQPLQRVRDLRPLLEMEASRKLRTQGPRMDPPRRKNPRPPALYSRAPQHQEKYNFAAFEASNGLPRRILRALRAK